MDSGVMDLCDLVDGLKRENKRIRAAAEHVVDKSFILMGCDSGELGELRKAIRKMVIELDKFAPSVVVDTTKKRRKP